MDRLEERYNVTLNHLFLSALNEIGRYKILSVDKDGSELRELEWNGENIYYFVRENIIVTFVPEGKSKAKFTRHAKKYEELLIKVNSYSGMENKYKNMITALKGKQKYINRRMNEELLNQKEKYQKEKEALFNLGVIKGIFNYLQQRKKFLRGKR